MLVGGAIIGWLLTDLLSPPQAAISYAICGVLSLVGVGVELFDRFRGRSKRDTFSR